MGIWRIPVDEIDRPGSFASHMNRSIVLLLNVLSQLKDYNTLLKVSSMLQRTPDQGKKYLRDADRQVLAQRAFILTVLVLEDMLNELTEVSKDQDSKCCSLLGARMTTDVSSKASAEEGQEALPKRTALSDGAVAAYGAENAVREVTQGQPPGTMDMAVEPQEAAPGPGAAEGPQPGPAEPMDLDEYSIDPGKLEAARGLPGRVCKDKAPESRTAELSLEDLSISSKHQQLDTVKVQVQAAPTEEISQRPSRKRKLINDTESGKTLLLDAYRVWQQGQKVMTYDLGKIEKIMSETYMLIKQVDEDAALEQAVKFCQVHIGASTQKQSAGETPTTPKYPRDSKESFFSAAPPSSAPPAGTADSVASDALLRLTDLHAKSKTASPSSCSSASVLLVPPQEQTGVVERIEGEVPPMSSLAREEEEQEEEEEEEEGGKLDRPLEGLVSQQQESQLCQQMKMATVAPSPDPACWQVELESVTSARSGGQICGQASGSKKELQTASQSLGSQPNKADNSRVRSRVLPNMPKLFIPSSVTKFPPEITVTPPTPTLLSPKGSISEETKQKLKSAILSAQSAANVKKESLCQPALEIVETSSQESSLEESDTDEEGDYMDV